MKDLLRLGHLERKRRWWVQSQDELMIVACSLGGICDRRGI
jgi:hypothetical protein